MGKISYFIYIGIFDFFWLFPHLLLFSLFRCATRYAEVADSVVLVLLDFLGGDGGYDVMQCVKSIVEQYPNFRYEGGEHPAVPIGKLFYRQ